jgi:hypothetical protein
MSSNNPWAGTECSRVLPNLKQQTILVAVREAILKQQRYKKSAKSNVKRHFFSFFQSIKMWFVRIELANRIFIFCYKIQVPFQNTIGNLTRFSPKDLFLSANSTNAPVRVEGASYIRID